MEWSAGESKTTVTTAVSTGTDQATLSFPNYHTTHAVFEKQ